MTSLKRTARHEGSEGPVLEQGEEQTSDVPVPQYLEGLSSKSKPQMPRVRNPAAQWGSFMVESTGHFDEPQESKQEREQQLCSADQIVDVPLLCEFEGARRTGGGSNQGSHSTRDARDDP